MASSEDEYDPVLSWVGRYSHAAKCNKPLPSIDELPAHQRPRAEEHVRLLGRLYGPPQPPPDTPRYQFVTFIGAGGMGEVWLAHDNRLRRKVAIKLLREKLSPDAAARLMDEARVVDQLDGKGIVPIYDVDKLPDGRPFFAMKFVQGETLTDKLDTRGTPQENLDHWLLIFERICEIVAYAHDHAVIHRDLKPSNIMMANDNEVFVLDWGLAKELSPQVNDSAFLEPGSSQLDERATTQNGLAKGTFAYMPPEQANGDKENIKARSDVFAIGAILCQILTGKPPYVGAKSEVIEKAQAWKIEEARERLHHSACPKELVTLVLQCMGRCPEDRPKNAGEVAKQVRQYREGVQKPTRRRWLIGLAAAAAVAITADLVFIRKSAVIKGMQTIFVEADPKKLGSTTIIYDEKRPNSRDADAIEDVSVIRNKDKKVEKFRVTLKPGINEGWFQAVHFNENTDAKDLVTYHLNTNSKDQLVDIKIEKLEIP